MLRNGYQVVAMNDTVRTMQNITGDALSLSVLLGYFVSYLPAIATVLTIVWTLIRIYETDTVQRWLGKKHEPLS